MECELLPPDPTSLAARFGEPLLPSAATVSFTDEVCGPAYEPVVCPVAAPAPAPASVISTEGFVPARARIATPAPTHQPITPTTAAPGVAVAHPRHPTRVGLIVGGQRASAVVDSDPVASAVAVADAALPGVSNAMPPLSHASGSGSSAAIASTATAARGEPVDSSTAAGAASPAQREELPEIVLALASVLGEMEPTLTAVATTARRAAGTLTSSLLEALSGASYLMGALESSITAAERSASSRCLTLYHNNGFGLTGHAVNCLAPLPNCALASGGADGAVRVWNVAAQRILRVLKHAGAADLGSPIVGSLLSLYGGTSLASGASDACVTVWDVETGVVTRMLQGTPDAWAQVSSMFGGARMFAGVSNASVLLSLPDGRIASTQRCYTDRNIRLFDLREGNEGRPSQTLRNDFASDPYADLLLLPPHGGAKCSDSGGSGSGSSDSPYLAAAVGSTVELWDVRASSGSGGNIYGGGSRRGPMRVLRGHTSRVSSLGALADGRLASAGGDDTTVRVWNAASGECELLLSDGVPVDCMACLPDGRLACTGGADADGALRVYSVDNGHNCHDSGGGDDDDEGDATSTAAIVQLQRALDAGGEGVPRGVGRRPLTLRVGDGDGDDSVKVIGPLRSLEGGRLATACMNFQSDSDFGVLLWELALERAGGDDDHRGDGVGGSDGVSPHVSRWRRLGAGAHIAGGSKLHAHSGRVSCFSVMEGASYLGDRLVSGSADYTVKVWARS